MQSNEPYIGSVRFFKNIIFLCCILGVLIPTGLALRWRSRAKTAESLLAQNAVVLTGEEDEAASEAEAASAETEPEADRLDGQEPCDPQALRGWQEGQRAVNAALLESLGKVLREPEASTRVSPILRRFF